MNCDRKVNPPARADAARISRMMKGLRIRVNLYEDTKTPLGIALWTVVKSTKPIKPERSGHPEGKGQCHDGQQKDDHDEGPFRKIPERIHGYATNNNEYHVEGIGDEHGAKVESRLRLKTDSTRWAYTMHFSKVRNPRKRKRVLKNESFPAGRALTGEQSLSEALVHEICWCGTRSKQSRQRRCKEQKIGTECPD